MGNVTLPRHSRYYYLVDETASPDERRSKPRGVSYWLQRCSQRCVRHYGILHIPASPPTAHRALPQPSLRRRGDIFR